MHTPCTCPTPSASAPGVPGAAPALVRACTCTNRHWGCLVQHPGAQLDGGGEWVFHSNFVPCFPEAKTTGQHEEDWSSDQPIFLRPVLPSHIPLSTCAQQNNTPLVANVFGLPYFTPFPPIFGPNFSLLPPPFLHGTGSVHHRIVHHGLVTMVLSSTSCLHRAVS